ncbi:secreted RxLR effector peptide protein, putative [Phytophthora infestans T30-4]|uniref:RxLR effector protein n=2 Tax=Phytophthora infestans TaxID=4787 RepID=D0NQU1_PHYIT|nr:secreted RxLR effector peptide protein, putative [Phytophthora infestans T30-4]EEY63039.1 secreted RxLR effector peptide protein, putative [Phytophthora infestans T30-4]KAF4138472.1 hypothetical protein GN958_ATG12338 [Phytophthora infestans]|eukprot:XP_002898562.1 secreted RxLR effector peptide protein, putative [Phytophthora infestans T30-4]
MRLRCFLVGAATIFSVTGAAVSRAKISLSDLSSGTDAHTAGKVAERFLRASHATDGGGDEERAGGGLSVPFVEKVKTLVTPLVVTPDIIRRWLKKEKSAASAFQRMHLQDAGDDLFLNEQFFKWVSYVDEFKVVTKNEKLNPISTLAAKYGDNSLYKLIEKARESTNVKTKEMATHLQAEQVRYWIDTRKDPSDVFQPKIKSSQDIFSNPEFRSWVKYVDDLNAKYPEHTVSMVPALRKYATDGDLLQLTLKAKKIDATKASQRGWRTMCFTSG